MEWVNCNYVFTNGTFSYMNNVQRNLLWASIFATCTLVNVRNIIFTAYSFQRGNLAKLSNVCNTNIRIYILLDLFVKTRWKIFDSKIYSV